MEVTCKETLLKGLLDWMQNLAISMGLFAAAAGVSFQDWQLNDRWGAAGISEAMAFFAIGYVALASWHFLRTHMPSKEHPRRQGVWIVMGIVVLGSVAECCAIVVMHHAAWENKRQTIAASHTAAPSNSEQPAAAGSL